MDNLFAPWRISYVKNVKNEEGCFFCRYLADSPEHDRENLVLLRGARAFVLLNRFPYTGGHLMIALNRHDVDFADATDDEFAETMRLARGAVRILRQVMNCQGVNLGWNIGRCAGAGVIDHLHLHAVPRWDGDTNYVPVLSGARVIPQALAEIYDELLPRFQAIGGERSDTD